MRSTFILSFLGIALAAGALFFAWYWANLSASFRVTERIIENRLWEIEQQLGLRLYSDGRLAITERDAPASLSEAEVTRRRQLLTSIPIPWVIRGAPARAALPLSTYIALAGLVVWGALVARSILIYFDVI